MAGIDLLSPIKNTDVDLDALQHLIDWVFILWVAVEVIPGAIKSLKEQRTRQMLLDILPVFVILVCVAFALDVKGVEYDPILLSLLGVLLMVCVMLAKKLILIHHEKKQNVKSE